MRENLSLGFLGFGEAGFEMARGLHAEGFTRMSLCHARKGDPERAALVRKRAQEAGVKYLGSAKEVAEQSDIIFSVVPPGEEEMKNAGN